MRATTPSRHVKEAPPSAVSTRAKAAVVTVVGVVTTLVVSGVASEGVASALTVTKAVLPRG
jgi:hypothetical protein